MCWLVNSLSPYQLRLHVKVVPTYYNVLQWQSPSRNRNFVKLWCWKVWPKVHLSAAIFTRRSLVRTNPNRLHVVSHLSSNIACERKLGQHLTKSQQVKCGGCSGVGTPRFSALRPTPSHRRILSSHNASPKETSGCICSGLWNYTTKTLSFLENETPSSVHILLARDRQQIGVTCTWTLFAMGLWLNGSFWIPRCEPQIPWEESKRQMVWKHTGFRKKMHKNCKHYIDNSKRDRSVLIAWKDKLIYWCFRVRGQMSLF